MRIPLDYYRILGLPIQATNEQLRQAHRDRTLQLPRREYSDAAISARKQLLDQAYAVLSSSERRESYDVNFLAKTYEAPDPDTALPGTAQLTAGSPSEDSNLVDPHTPIIEIEDNQFIGALLVLQELGEYELVLKLGRTFLIGGNGSLSDGRYGDPSIAYSDIVLTVALACLELGREQWQQGQYENAAEALETGQQLLLREGLFAGVRGEVQSDLYRLRPYRVLELLASSENIEERQAGMELLEEMLRERGGIDGSENDQSGLTIDDFLRFIQQLRGYLTAEEQQYLFEQEANRPSAVATYLAVYALLSRGFTERQPQLVYRAKQYLSRLSGRQDVHLEQAISALLLGQTEEASQSLDHSQEQDSIAFIRQHSQGSPDLLPGLCLYTERWFQDEVFPHFRDLAQRQASLKDYFADRQVQAYLEELPTEAEAIEAERSMPLHISAQVGSSQAATASRDSVGVRANAESLKSVAANREAYSEIEGETDRDSLIAVARSRIASRSTAATLGSENRFSGGVSTAERIAQSTDTDDSSVSRSPFQRLRPNGERPKDGEGDDSTKMPPRRMGDRPPRSRSAGIPRWVVPGVALLGILALAGLAALRIAEWRSASQSAALTDKEMLVDIDQPLASLPADSLSPTTATTLDKESAKQLIGAWLAAKAKALGSTHEVDALDQILMDPSLSKWRTDAEDLKRNNEYRSYKHEVKIESVELASSNSSQAALDPTQAANPSPDLAMVSPNPNQVQTASPNPDATTTAQPNLSEPASGQPVPESAATSPNSGSTTATQPDSTKPSLTPSAPDQAKVVAEVTETTETYRDGKLDGSSQTDNLRVQYNLVRKNGRWRIQDWQLL